jgi:hypothetical protein
MKCNKCPLYRSWSNESDSGEECGLFGDAWDNLLQYEDKEGTIIGCYVDRHYIEKVDKSYIEHLEQEAAAFAKEWDSVDRELGDLFY